VLRSAKPKRLVAWVDAFPHLATTYMACAMGRHCLEHPSGRPRRDPGRARGTRLEGELNLVPYGPSDNFDDSRLLHLLTEAFTHDDISLKADISVRRRRTLIIIFQSLQAENVRKQRIRLLPTLFLRQEFILPLPPR